MTGSGQCHNHQWKFLLTRPSRDVTSAVYDASGQIVISTHTPLAGRDKVYWEMFEQDRISTHTPLAGRDGWKTESMLGGIDFYSHAPRGT